MTQTNSRAHEIKTLRAQIKERLAQIRREADFLKSQEAKLKAEAKAEREAEKARKAQAKADKAAKKAQKEKEKEEAKANRARGRKKAEQPRQEAPKSDKRKEEESVAASVAAELMRDFGLRPSSTIKQIREIRRAYAKKYHPDLVGGDGLRMKIANTMLDGAEKTAKYNEQKAAA